MSYLSINKVALRLNISPNTIKRWYKWYESSEYSHPEDMVLPKYYYLDGRRTMMFDSEDLGVLKTFKKKICTTHKGVMAEFNANYQWGTRGKAINERRKLNEQNEDCN